MADLKRISEETDTSEAIVRAIAEHVGDDDDVIRETIENPEDFDAIIVKARQQTDGELRWQGRAVL